MLRPRREIANHERSRGYEGAARVNEITDATISDAGDCVGRLDDIDYQLRRVIAVTNRRPVSLYPDFRQQIAYHVGRLFAVNRYHVHTS